MKSTDVASLLFAAAVAVPSAGIAQNSAVPDGMSYQGYLTDQDGSVIGDNGAVNQALEFRVYTQATGGDALWAEEQTVSVLNGNFSVVLGNGTALNENIGSEAEDLVDVLATSPDANYYFSITPSGGDEFTPRQQILSSAFSYHSKTAETAASLATDGGMRIASFGENNTFQLSEGGLRVDAGNIQLLDGEIQIAPRKEIRFGVGPDQTNRNVDGKIGYDPSREALKIVGAGNPSSDDSVFIEAQGGTSTNGSLYIEDEREYIEFGSGFNAKPSGQARIGYNLIRDGVFSLDIVGAGGDNLDTSNGQRVKIQADEMTEFTGPIKSSEVGVNNWTLQRPVRFLRFYYEDDYMAYISNTDGSYNQRSDRRLKKDIEPIESALEDVCKLQPKRFRYKRNDSDVERTPGFIAQEVREVFPELVSESEGEYLSLSYAQFVPYTVRAIQEQQETIEGLRSRVADLETQVATVAALKADLRDERAANEKTRSRLSRIEAQLDQSEADQ